MPESPHARRRRIVLQAGAIVLAASWLPRARALSLGEERRVTLRRVGKGTVTAVDAAARRLRMRGPEGEATYRVDARVRELEQVRVGDEVRLDYVAGLGLTLRRGSRELPEKAGSGPLLEGAGGGQAVTALTRVLAVDAARRSLRLRGPRGQESDFEVADPSDLHGVKVGDQLVVVVYTLMAVGIIPAAR